jgi:ABC-type enterobactin transport system permease subunit
MVDLSGLLIEAKFNAQYSILWSFIVGGLIGIGCVQCVLPLAVYGAAEGGTRKGFMFAILFNLPRLLMFLTLGIIAAISTGIIQSLTETIEFSPHIYGFGSLLTGMVLILFSAELFGVINLDRLIASRFTNALMPILKRDFETHNLGAIARGFMFSLVCSLESSLILIGIWGIAILSSDPLFAFLAVSAFGMGNVVFTTIAATIMGASTGFLKRKTRMNIPRYASVLGSIVILFMGLVHFTIGLNAIL